VAWNDDVIIDRIREGLKLRDAVKEKAGNRDREEPRDSPPPTPPGIRITYHGGSVD